MQDIKESLANSGAAIPKMPQGIPRTRYYTPDGREQFKIPQYRTRGDGVVYDIFLAQGYTLTPPENPKSYCAGCDRWHDTQEEIEACIKAKKKFATQMQKKAEQELAQEDNKDKEIAELTNKVNKLTELLEEKLGTQIQ